MTSTPPPALRAEFSVMVTLLITMPRERQLRPPPLRVALFQCRFECESVELGYASTTPPPKLPVLYKNTEREMVQREWPDTPPPLPIARLLVISTLSIVVK